MVPGIDSFREKFKDYTDYYTIIGGTACDILLSEADLPFRATKDIDMILIMEDNFPEFASVFWEYIKEGGYKCGWKNEQNMHFYRFTEGKFGYPTMIELFSRKPGYHLEIEEGIIPIHIDDDTSSLSAILLNDDFYKFMMSGRRVVDGIGVLGAEHLIPFKMYAWINLLDRKRAGEHVNEKDLKKHKYDVFRLLQIVTAGTKVESEGLVTESIHRYVEEISAVDESEVRLLQMGMPFDRDRGVELLKEIYLQENCYISILGDGVMRVLVIPDIHLKPWIFDRTEKILRDGKADRAVCLMDMPDDWNMEFQIERYKETFDRAIAFAEDYPDTLWCYGNHDVSYSWGRLETGYSPYAERTVMSKLEELENRLKSPVQINIMHRIDNVLFSHGGLTADFLNWLNKDLLDADIEEVIAAVNDAPHDYLWNDESPLWFRPQYETREIFRADIYKQVVGHTPVERIFEKDGIISTDVFSTYRDGRQIGESAMMVIDSETGKYEKIEVMGKLGV